MDTNIRELERRANAGDPIATAKLAEARQRSGIDPKTGFRILPEVTEEPWQTLPNGTVAPVVGAGAWKQVGSDRYPYTVVAVSKTGNTITLRSDTARILKTDKVRYVENPASRPVTATRRKAYRQCGYCGNVTRDKTCDASIACREKREASGGEPLWYPVYAPKGQKGRISPYHIGGRSYYQDPHF